MAKKDMKTVKESLFTKEQVLNSKMYIGKKDIINTLLDDKKIYSFSEVDSIVAKFMKGSVK